MVTTYVNGRLLHTQQLSVDHDPWIAVRNDYKNEGGGFNVRVTGQPEFPDSIRVTASPMLEGWLPYFGGAVGWSESLWQGLYRGNRAENPDADTKRGGGIFGSRETNGIDYEPALFYHRPLLEDGTIEYEFFYRQDALTAHPAIDRLCFLMEPSGVRTHWLTDGIYDRTEISPDNVATELSNRRGPKSLPLMDNSWNHTSVKLTGDTVELTLNGQLVYQRTLESTNQRHFGFFHYADRSELRVRNVVWKGNWPRSLPSVTDQELATDEADFLDQNAEHMTAVFRHNFTAAGFDQDRFSVIHGSPDEDLKATPDGLLALRLGNGGYRNTTIAPNLQVDGDFDITVAYDNYESIPTAGGSSSLMLIATLDNASSDEFCITRRQIQDTAESARQIVQCVTVQKRAEGEGRDYFITMPAEERSGRLRLSRRGNQIYYLSAEGDSPNFQLKGSRQISRDSIRAEGIRLVNQTYKEGHSSVIWKSLSVHAEKLNGNAVGEANPRLEALNKQREHLAANVIYDFTKASPDPVVLYRWGDVRQWDSEKAGLRIQADGSDAWDSAGLKTRYPINGDFDIMIEFDVVALDMPRTGDQTSVILQLETLDEDSPQLNNIFHQLPSGQQEVLAQMRQTATNGDPTYRRIETIQVASVSALRTARRGTKWTMLARMKDADQERIVAEIEASDQPIREARLLLHTGGANRRSEILLKQIHIHAQEYAPLRPFPAVPQKKQNLIESLLELFR
ncbi:MAG: DUF1583 domain-containing protein [Planctomycetota bacterium]|nr:DUF1583 domain-containing protein [Planctomycetota bacterium]